jgi:cytochrome c biogenesis protein CcmG, thiol:disulfide interchange protein DsbE
MQILPEVPIYQKPPAFVVPYWSKVLFSWMAVILLLSLIGFQAHKRWLYRKLYVFNMMRPEIVVDQVAPVFNLQKGEDGPPIVLSYFGKKWVLLHFWATWCLPCREEMPSLEILHRELSDKMVVLTASVDNSWEEVHRFFNGNTPQMLLAWDKEQKTAKSFSVDKYPETFLISPNGKIAVRFSGPRDWSSPEALQYLQQAMQ